MKRILTAVGTAAMALLVMVVLAAPASAGTVICATPKTPCSLEQVEPTNSYVVTADNPGFPSFTLSASGLPYIECSSNVMGAGSKNSIGDPLAAEFYGTLSGCIKGKSACEGSMNHPPTVLEASATGGLMKIGTAAQPLILTFECAPEGANSCTYTAKETVNLDVQAEEAKVLYVPFYLSASSGSCFASSPKVSVRNYTAIEGYISKYAATGTVICKTSEDPCNNEANRYGSGTSLEAAPETKAIFTNPIYKTECSSSSLAGQLTGSGGVGKEVPFGITSASFTGCSNSTTVTVEGLPWLGTIVHGDLFGEAEFRMYGVKMKFVRLGVICYYGGNVIATIQGNSKLLFASSGLEVLPGSSALCGGLGTKSGKWNASYSLTAPSPFYVSWQ